MAQCILIGKAPAVRLESSAETHRGGSRNLRMVVCIASLRPRRTGGCEITA